MAALDVSKRSVAGSARPPQRAYMARSECLREWLDAHQQARDVVIDEIQKVPALLDVVHQQIESRNQRRFILTGSSARKLRRDATNLHWRTKSGSEVDFVVYGAQTFAAWEVKHAARVHHSDLRALKAFGEDYPEASVYLDQERLEIDGVAIVPCHDFL